MHRCTHHLLPAHPPRLCARLSAQTHYIELFKESGGSYKAFGDSGFKHESSGHAKSMVEQPSKQPPAVQPKPPVARRPASVKERVQAAGKAAPATSTDWSSPARARAGSTHETQTDSHKQG